MIIFEHPAFAFLLLLPFLVRFLLPAVKESSGRAIKVPFLNEIKTIQTHFFKGSYLSQNFFSSNFFFLFLSWIFLTLSMMKPVLISDPVKIQNKGHDILLMTDISTSMLEEDFVYQRQYITRLDAVRAVVSDFVQKRPTDRIGLILFGTRAYLQVPLTFDKQASLDVLSTMKAGMAGQSTAIGDAIGLAVKTLSADKELFKNQVIILLTDGENNDGAISLPKALQLAKEEGVKIYTIGIGSERFNLARAIFGAPASDLDEKSLKKLAKETKGQYFKATSLSDLIAVYNKIDTLEAKEIENGFIYPKKDLYTYPLSLALCLLIGILSFEFLRQRRSL